MSVVLNNGSKLFPMYLGLKNIPGPFMPQQSLGSRVPALLNSLLLEEIVENFFAQWIFISKMMCFLQQANSLEMTEDILNI